VKQREWVVGQWRIIASRGWIRPDLGVRFLLVWGGARRWQGWSLAVVHDAQWQRVQARRRKDAEDSLRLLRMM
jgi:hypothetical protein